MKPGIPYLFILMLICVLQTRGQQTTYSIQPLMKAPISSIRGLSVVSDSVVWVSGSQGMVGRSTDGGKEWKWMKVNGCDSCDWRDIEAFSATKAIIINAGEPTHIFLTKDGGHTWRKVYFNNTKGIFYDGMDFWNDREGIAVGDPLNGVFTLLQTADGGETWQPFAVKTPPAREGEASFAASGTTIRTLGPKSFCFVSGGAASRLFVFNGSSWTVHPTPLIQGQPSTGAFSIAFSNDRRGIAVGGDYQKDTIRTNNCFMTKDGGATWDAPSTPPLGFRSAVEYIRPQMLIATGTSGTDISENGGIHWHNISREGYHTARRAKQGEKVFLAGSNGRIAILLSK
ncbi:oxidoreductase [Chitinophaga horti]|uniref:Oxidoreductase n=1 Tax=Chitinophaga horti TaxID=2920382 RepID=A0ABY6J5J8_9BACT|nr:oxidoreductase [Chitinophaga horti]UYQ94780.1 oxidoreductase [Chitinophaga horti]